MNNDRRKALMKLQGELGPLKERAAKLVEDHDNLVGDFTEALEGVKGDIENIKSEEDEYYNNMPESLQGGEKGEQAQAAVAAMDEAMERLDEGVAALGEAKEALEKIETAVDECDNHLGEAQDG